LVDLVGIEPTTSPASRDALTLGASKLLSAPGANDATSSSLAVALAVVPRLTYRTAPDRPKSTALGRGLKLSVRAGVRQLESRAVSCSQYRIFAYFHSARYIQQP